MQEFERIISNWAVAIGMAAVAIDDEGKYISKQYNFTDFCKMIANPQSVAQNVRDELDTKLDENSRILVLSTCISGDKSSRYLVCAVLLSDELTN